MKDREILKRLELERWRRKTQRAGKQYKPKNPDIESLDDISGQDHYLSPILDLFAQKFRSFDQRRHKKAAWFVVPRTFSLTKDPSAALSFYRDVAAHARSARAPQFWIDHRGVDDMGLAADAVLGVLMKEISLECRARRGYSMRGWKAKKPDVRRMMEDIGCVRVMTDNSLDDARLDVELHARKGVFRNRGRGTRSTDPLSVDRDGRLGKKFSDHVDECLGSVKKKLTAKGRHSLLRYYNEIIDNIHQHSGLRESVVVGYIDPTDPDLTYRCTIVSFGHTFASTFEALPEGSSAYSYIEPYLNAHRAAGWFSSGWRAEDLIAVAALQGDVSSKNESTDDTRGQGTVEFIKFFQFVSSSCVGSTSDATMTLLTGRTLIHFDGRYSMVEQGANRRKVIAFNNEDDLTKPPDPAAVIAINDGAFPGVVISIAAPLARAVVEAQMNHGNEN